MKRPGSEVTVVIPCYNEQEALPYLSNTLRSVETKLAEGGYATSFVFVDDAARTITLQLLNELFGDREKRPDRPSQAKLGRCRRHSDREFVPPRPSSFDSMDCDCHI